MWFRWLVMASVVSGCSASIPIEAAPRAPVAKPSRIETPRAIALEDASGSESSEASESGSEAPLAEIDMPSACANPDASICTPPESFTRELCKSKHPDLALALFGKQTPFTRAYLRLNTQAWYAGARLTAPADLRLDEEVLILADRTQTGGFSVGGGSFDVLRWDGQCVSLMADEVSLKRPAAPTVAPIVWRRLLDDTQAALRAAPRIELALTRSRERCKDDRGAPECVEANEGLSLTIAGWVRSGGDVPEPRLVMSR